MYHVALIVGTLIEAVCIVRNLFRDQGLDFKEVGYYTVKTRITLEISFGQTPALAAGESWVWRVL